MTITMAVDSSNDLYLDVNGQIALAYDEEAVAQLSVHYAQAVLGEMIYQTQEGVPYFETIFANRNVAAFRAGLITQLRRVPEVIRIASLAIAIDGDTVNYTAEIESSFGLLATSGAVTSGGI